MERKSEHPNTLRHLARMHRPPPDPEPPARPIITDLSAYDHWAYARDYKVDARESRVRELAFSYQKPFTSREMATKLGLHVLAVARIMMVLRWPRTFSGSKNGGKSLWSPCAPPPAEKDTES